MNELVIRLLNNDKKNKEIDVWEGKGDIKVFEFHAIMEGS